MSENGQFGMILASNAQKNEIMGNTFLDNHYANFFIDNTSGLTNYNHIASNTLGGSVNQFDMLIGGTGNVIEHNILRGSAIGNVGISVVAGAPGNVIRDNTNTNHPSGGGDDYRIASNTYFSDPNPTSSYTLSVTGGAVLTYPTVSLVTQTEGAALSVSSNTIAPTNPIHRVGAGLIKTITLPGGFTGGTIALVPTAAFTYDATGNVLGTGTAVVGRTMFATYSPSTSKWSMSY
jgi:hypothetical protein